MAKLRQIFKFSNDPNNALKFISDGNDSYEKGKVNAPLLISEIKKLKSSGLLKSALKIDSKPYNQLIYTFYANTNDDNNMLYQNHGISAVNVVFNKDHMNLHIDYITALELMIDDNVKGLISYQTSNNLFETGIVMGELVNGFSLGTYFTPKLALGVKELKTDIQNYNESSDTYTSDELGTLIEFDNEAEDTKKLVLNNE